MKFGVIGSGRVGQTMAKGLRRHGYDVRIGSRSGEKVSALSAATGVQAGTFADVAAWAEAVVLAVHGAGAQAALALAGAANLAGKVVIDVTNPLADAPPDDGVVRFFTGPNESLMEQLQASFPAAKFVKAFNSIGADLMVNPVLPGGMPTMFYCGNDEAAKQIVATIIAQFGWEGADMGKAAAARAIEPLAQLWCIPGFLTNQWTHAFKLLRA